MSLTLKGKLIRIMNPESGVARNGNQWKKQEFVIETLDQFPKKVCFSLFNEKLNLLGSINEGEDLEISFDIESREFNNKWYHNLNAWKVEKTAFKPGSIPPPPFMEDDIPAEFSADAPGDLPF